MYGEDPRMSMSTMTILVFEIFKIFSFVSSSSATAFHLPTSFCQFCRGQLFQYFPKLANFCKNLHSYHFTKPFLPSHPFTFTFSLFSLPHESLSIYCHFQPTGKLLCKIKSYIKYLAHLAANLNLILRRICLGIIC